MMAPVLTWLNRHPTLVDAGLTVLAVLILGLPMLDGWYDRPSQVITGLLLLPLLVRRRFPFLVPLVAAGICGAQLFVLGIPLLPVNALVVVYVYSAVANAARAWQRYVIVGLGLFGAWAEAFVPPNEFWSQRDRAAEFAWLALTVGVAWVLGESVRYRARIVERLEEQNRALARDQEHRAQLVAQHERSRIAREMHDIVAHSLAVVVVQADGGAYAARKALAGQESEPLDAAAATLETVAAHARGALAETRRLVGILRDDAAAEYRPLEGVAQVGDLVSTVAAMGRDAVVHETGPVQGVGSEVGAAAYRIVQEALTNVLKHAGPAARATVHLDADAHELRVKVADDGLGAAAADDGCGHGVTGMRERAAALGGRLQAGPRPGGGFEVVAHLPLRSAPSTQETR